MKHSSLVVVAVAGCGVVDQKPPDAMDVRDAPVEPDTSITGNPPALDNSASVTFTFASTESAATFECRLDAAAFAPCTTPHVVTDFAEGPHELAVRAVVGEVVDPTPATYAWTYDASAPDTTLVAAPPPFAASTSASLQFSSPRSTGVTFECAIDAAAFAPCVSPVALVALAEGPHVFAVRARDALGNVDPTPASVMWTVDVTAPETQMAGPTGLINTTTATFELLSEPDAVFECSVDGAPFAACSSPFAATGLAQGAHVMAARAIDRAGNVDPSPVDFTFEVDSIAPDTSIVSGPASPTNAGVFSFNLASNDPTATFECATDAGPFAACADPHAITATEGAHVRRVRAVDAAGNVDPTPAEHAWTVDRTGPVITLTGPATGGTSGPFVQYTFTVDDGSPVQCRFDTAAFAPCTASAARNLPAGAHSFTIRATDGAANTTQITRSFTVACAPQTGGNGGLGLFHFEETSGQQLTNALVSNLSAVLGSAAAIEVTDPARVAAGRFGRALSFDSADRNTVLWNTLNLTTSRHVFEAWVQPRRALVGAGGSSIFLSEDARVRVWYEERDATTVSVRYSLTSSSGVTTTVERTASYGDWHHVLAYFENPTMQLWIDGVVVQATASISGSFTIGSPRISDPADPVDGLIDEVYFGTGGMSTQSILERYCPL